MEYFLKYLNFGEGFNKWVIVIYLDPRAAVTFNSMILPFFNLKSGIKQGDPLSPLLIMLFLESLANIIRAENGIKGILKGGEEHKICLYTDDIL